MNSIYLISWLILPWTASIDYAGTYEFKSGEPEENHYIVIVSIGGQISGEYYGSEDGKGHGIYFFKNKMENLKCDNNGNIEFEIGDRKLYDVSLFNKKHSDPETSNGTSRSPIKYKGKITKDTIEVTCTSEFYDCWTDNFIFQRLVSTAR